MDRPFANYSRYIRPGAVRIGSTSSNSAVDISAYKNTNDTVAVVMLNTLSSSDTVNYSTSGIGGTSGTVTPFLTNRQPGEPAGPATAADLPVTTPAAADAG
jgi:glucuronoarabinoxylan endo-1,4-beta-xylanase